MSKPRVHFADVLGKTWEIPARESRFEEELRRMDDDRLRKLETERLRKAEVVELKAEVIVHRDRSWRAEDRNWELEEEMQRMRIEMTRLRDENWRLKNDNLELELIAGDLTGQNTELREQLEDDVRDFPDRTISNPGDPRSLDPEIEAAKMGRSVYASPALSSTASPVVAAAGYAPVTMSGSLKSGDDIESPVVSPAVSPGRPSKGAGNGAQNESQVTL